MLISFTERQSSAISSLYFHENNVKIRYKTGRTAYPFTGDIAVIEELKIFAQTVKKNPADNSIGSYVHNLIKEDKITRIPFNYNFDEVITYGNTNKEIYSVTFALMFKTVYYSFQPVGNKMHIVKLKSKDMGDMRQCVTEINHTFPITYCRKLWINLTKGRKVKTFKYVYHYD